MLRDTQVLEQLPWRIRDVRRTRAPLRHRDAVYGVVYVELVGEPKKDREPPRALYLSVIGSAARADGAPATPSTRAATTPSTLAATRRRNPRTTPSG